MNSLAALPKDIQIELLSTLDTRTLGHLCQTDSSISQLCKDENLWKLRFLEIVKDDYIPNEIASTWFQKVRLILALFEPQTSLTLFTDDTTSMVDLGYKGTHSWQFQKNFEILGNYVAKEIKISKNCLMRDYNNRNQPMYGVMTRAMNQYLKIQTEKRYRNKNKKYPEINAFANILKSGLTNFDYLYYITINDNISPSFDVSEIPFFDLEPNSSNESLTLVEFHSYDFGRVSLTISGTNVDKMYALLATIINYYQLIKDNGRMWSKHNHEVYVIGNNMWHWLQKRDPNKRPIYTKEDVKHLFSLRPDASKDDNTKYEIIKGPLRRC